MKNLVISLIIPTVSGEQFVEGLKVWLKMKTNRETKLKPR